MQNPDGKMQKWSQFQCSWPAAAVFRPGCEGRICRMVMERLARTPDVRTELVIPLRLAIEEDRYHVPEEQVAERMIYRCLASKLN